MMLSNEGWRGLILSKIFLETYGWQMVQVPYDDFEFIKDVK